MDSHTDQETVINVTHKQLPAISRSWNDSVNQKDSISVTKICFFPMFFVEINMVGVAFLVPNLGQKWLIIDIFQICHMDFLKTLQGVCQSYYTFFCPSQIKMKRKFDLDFEAR